MTPSENTLMSLFRRLEALEIAMAWAITQGRQPSFLDDGIDRIKRGFASNGSDEYDLEDVERQFEPLGMWAHVLSRMQFEQRMADNHRN